MSQLIVMALVRFPANLKGMVVLKVVMKVSRGGRFFLLQHMPLLLSERQGLQPFLGKERKRIGTGFSLQKKWRLSSLKTFVQGMGETSACAYWDYESL